MDFVQFLDNYKTWLVATPKITKATTYGISKNVLVANKEAMGQVYQSLLDEGATSVNFMEVNTADNVETLEAYYYDVWLPLNP